MSDSIKKYHENREHFDKLELKKKSDNNREYTELELIEVAANIARKYKELPAKMIIMLAKDELAVKKVCD